MSRREAQRTLAQWHRYYKRCWEIGGGAGTRMSRREWRAEKRLGGPTLRVAKKRLAVLIASIDEVMAR